MMRETNLMEFIVAIVLGIILCIAFYIGGKNSAKRHYEPIIQDQKEIIEGYEYLADEKVAIQDGVVEIRISFEKMKEEIAHFQYWAELFRQIMKEEKPTDSMKIDKVSEDD